MGAVVVGGGSRDCGSLSVVGRSVRVASGYAGAEVNYIYALYKSNSR